MKMHKWKWILLSLSVFCLSFSNGSDHLTDDEEDMSYYLGKLFEEPREGDLDPHDMLNFGRERTIPKEEAEPFNSDFSNLQKPNEESCSFDKMKSDENLKVLEECQKQLEILRNNFESDKHKLKKLEKKLLNEGSLDMKAFYLRVVYHLWNVLSLEEVQNTLKQADEAMIRRLFVRITKEDVILLQNFMNHQENAQEVDEFLHKNFELDVNVEEPYEFNIRAWIDSAVSIMEVGKNVEVWLYMLCIGFLTLAVWAVYLFIRDIQEELRWMRVIMMMFVLLFFICCLWHWRHMHKLAESRRHAKMMKRGFTDIPEECKPGHQGTTQGVFEWISVRVFGSPDVCERYFEELMVDPSEEITPAMVISETLAKFFLQPLQHLGSESAKFITNFYANVPLVYQAQATIFFIILLIILLFAFCGYGIDFPLWLGGIRPIYKTETADTAEVDRITKEAIKQLKNDREKFLAESRMMLTSIADAAAATTQTQAGIQPLIMMSSNIIEDKLEHLIARQFANVLPGTIPNTKKQEITPEESGRVFTVTSTPLRENWLRQSSTSSFDGEDVSDSKEVGKDKPFNKEDESNANAVVAVPDVAHYRFGDGLRKRHLPPKETRSPSPSSVGRTKTPENIRSTNVKSVESIPSKAKFNTSLHKRKPNSKDNPTFTSTPSEASINESHSDSNLSISDVVSQENFYDKVKGKLLRKRKPESRDNPTCSSTPSEVSTDEPHSDSNLPISDEVVLDENFYDRVKSILDDSVNSSLNQDSSISGEHNTSVRSPNISQDMENTGDEVELSASGVKFLSKVKNVMTP